MKKQRQNFRCFFSDIFKQLSANISSACPPSSRVSPVCYPQNPSGGDTLGSRTLSDVASLCHLSLWCKKKQSAPATAYKFWCSALPSSSPLLLAFRHATSKCLYKNASNKPYVSKNAIFRCIVRKSPDLPADAYLSYVRVENQGFDKTRR